MRQVRPVTVALLAAAALACATSAGCARSRLRDERLTEPYASALRQADRLGSRSFVVDGAPAGADPVRMNLVQVPRVPHGKGPLLVMQSGILSDHGTWRFLAPLLAADHDCLLIDPPGCGASDKPRVERLGDDGYTPAWLAEHTFRAVRRWERQSGAGRRRLVVIGHSMGGLAFLMALGDEEIRARNHDVCARVEKLVLFQSADVGVRETHEDLARLATVPDWQVAAIDGVGVLRLGVDAGIETSVVDPARALRMESERVHSSLARTEVRRAVQAVLRRFRPSDRCGKPDWEAVAALEARYANVTQPTLLVYGAQDEFVPASVGRRLVTLLPHARLHVVSDAKHSPHMEVPVRSAGLIRAFLESGSAAPWGLRAYSARSE